MHMHHMHTPFALGCRTPFALLFPAHVRVLAVLSPGCSAVPVPEHSDTKLGAGTIIYFDNLQNTNQVPSSLCLVPPLLETLCERVLDLNDFCM